MIMETLISRGGAPVHYRINGFNYLFRRNDDGHFVCPVLSGEHVQTMLKTGNFRIYVPRVPVTVHPDVPLITTRPADTVDTVDTVESVLLAPTQGDKPKRRGSRRKRAE